MGSTRSARGAGVRPLESWEEPWSVRQTTLYLKRLLIERHAIRAKLLNPGGSFIINPARRVEVENMPVDYSTVLGNDLHLDLLDAEQTLRTLPTEERGRLLQWCDGLTYQEAATFANVKPGSIRVRVSRSLRKMVEAQS